MKRLARSRVWLASLDADQEAKVRTRTKRQLSWPPELVSTVSLSGHRMQGLSLMYMTSNHLWNILDTVETETPNL